MEINAAEELILYIYINYNVRNKLKSAFKHFLDKVNIFIRHTARRFLTSGSMNQFTKATEYPIRAVSNFLENSQRYLQLKMHHCCR
jgi:hypothetical protein